MKNQHHIITAITFPWNGSATWLRWLEVTNKGRRNWDDIHCSLVNVGNSNIRYALYLIAGFSVAIFIYNVTWQGKWLAILLTAVFRYNMFWWEKNWEFYQNWSSQKIPHFSQSTVCYVFSVAGVFDMRKTALNWSDNKVGCTMATITDTILQQLM